MGFATAKPVPLDILHDVAKSFVYPYADRPNFVYPYGDSNNTSYVKESYERSEGFPLDTLGNERSE